MPQAVVLLQPGAADWEYGPVLALLRAYFEMNTLTATPDGRSVVTMGGLRIEPDVSFDTAPIADAELVLLIGSDAWLAFDDKPLHDRLAARAAAGRPTAGVCAGTLPLARAGVLNTRAHTSNAKGFLAENAPGYSGERYVDAAHAITDGGVVTASGAAAASFACAVGALVRPEQAPAVLGYWAMAKGEFEALGDDLTPVLASPERR